MKSKIAIGVIALLFAIMALILFLTSYRSAFEADQACHYEKWVRYAESPEYGCDHDLETKQWILFENGISNNPAKVIKRFRY